MHFYLKHLVFYLLSLLSITTTLCQSTGSFTISLDGTSPQFLTLLKHSKGYILAGTTNGLYRFDGHVFEPYETDNRIKNRAVTAIAEDKRTIWLGFKDGEIGLLKNKRVELLQAEEGHPAVAITSIAVDTAGTVYFGTAGEGVYYYKNKRFYNVNMDDGLSDNYVYEVRLNYQGVIVCTDRGINTINIVKDKKTIYAFNSANGLPDNIVRCMYPVGAKLDQGYWIGMQDKGLGLYNATNSKPFTLVENWRYGQVNSILSANNQLWIATEGDGIINYDFERNILTPSSITLLDKGSSKSNNLLPDDEGNIWFTSQEQLIKTNGDLLQNIIPLTTAQVAEVHAVLADTKGNIWINNNKGIVKYFFQQEQQKWQSTNYVLPIMGSKTDITSLYEDRFGNIWIGTLGKGLIILDPITGRNRLLTEEHLLVEGSVLSINGRNDEIWMSCLGGVVHCNLGDENKDIFKKYTFIDFSNVSSSIGSNYVYSIFIDSKDRVWFATDGKGLTVYDHGRFKNYNESNGIKSHVIYNICEDKKGNIWFSTLNNGIYKFDGRAFINISTAQGLNDATITAMVTDRSNNIIAVSKKGINIINADSHNVSYLDANQGVTEINTDLNCIAANEAVYLISHNGVLKYRPTAVSLKPKIVLEGVGLFLDDINFREINSFSYDENNLTFSYFGISYSHPDKIRYQYKLEGLSNDWIETRDDNINFPKLPPGNYTFRVRASINKQFEGSDEVSYSFIVRKPFWLQWWFIKLSIVLLVIALYLFIKYREKQVKRWERIEKEKIQSQFETLKSQVNPHFLFNSFNTLISVIEEDQESAVEYVEHLSDLYRKIVTYRDKDIITIKEEIAIIADYFFIQKKRFGDNLSFVNNLTDDQQVTNMIAPLTLQLLVENAVKHNAISSETPLVIELSIRGKLLEVKNNINQKLTIEKGAGMGLQNIENRYKLLTKESFSIQKTGHDFIVNIPLLHSLNHEDNINH
jgi:ligand-binding sensor domain-containing protein